MTHAVWHFAKSRNPIPRRVATARETHKIQEWMISRSAGFKYRGHELARPR